MIRETEVFRIGAITRTHGISGEVEMQFTDDVFDRGTAEYFVLLLDGIFVPFFWEEYKFKSNTAALVKFEDIASDTAARRLVGHAVYYPLSHIPEEEEAELPSLKALTGFRVRESRAGELGTVEHVDDSSANVLLTIIGKDGRELLIPFHDDFLTDYDLRARTLGLRLPEGLLTINDNTEDTL